MVCERTNQLPPFIRLAFRARQRKRRGTNIRKNAPAARKKPTEGFELRLKTALAADSFGLYAEVLPEILLPGIQKK